MTRLWDNCSENCTIYVTTYEQQPLAISAVEILYKYQSGNVNCNVPKSEYTEYWNPVVSLFLAPSYIDTTAEAIHDGHLWPDRPAAIRRFILLIYTVANYLEYRLTHRMQRRSAYCVIVESRRSRMGKPQPARCRSWKSKKIDLKVEGQGQTSPTPNHFSGVS